MSRLSEWLPAQSCRRLVKTRKVFLLIFGILGLLFMNPLSWIGEEELGGWERNRTRDVGSFIQPDNVTTVISPKICDGRHLFLLVVVCSAVQNVEARKAVRETWAARLNEYEDGRGSAFIVFLLGNPEHPTLQLPVEEESEKHGDIVQERFIDSYNNLTLKSVMLLKWVRQECSSALYVMKTDDDTLVNLIPLQGLLESHQASLTESQGQEGQPLLVGYLIRAARPIRNPQNKWYMPRYLYAGQVYPDYLSGAGYVMSQSAVQALYEASLVVPLVHLEDVYITGQCAEHAGITRIGHLGFSYKRRPMTTCALGNPQVITTHKLDPQNIRRAWNLSRMSTAQCNRTASYVSTESVRD